MRKGNIRGWIGVEIRIIVGRFLLDGNWMDTF